MDRFNLYNPTGDISMASVLFDGSQHQRVNPVNVFTQFFDAFDSYVEGAKWISSRAAGDLILVDGNTAGAQWLDFSLDPLRAGTVSLLTCNTNFEMPVEFSIGAHMSQRTLGQEFSIEMVDQTVNPVDANLPIGLITQNGATLTVVTSTPHGYTPGDCIGINSVTDGRLNYPALVVATIPTNTQFTVTAGPGGAIPSITAGPTTSGFVYRRPRLGISSNGTSMIFENATATNASFYVRAGTFGDSLPSGTIAGNQSATVASTASVAAVSAANVYAFQPTSEYKLLFEPARIQWNDVAIDSLAQPTNRINRTQVIPNTNQSYVLRIRGVNNASLSVPVGFIGLTTKNGSTTATVTTLTPHGLTTSDVVTAYGTRDQTNFPNLTTATGISSILSPTQFQLVWGTATTTFTQSGVIVRVNGGNLPSALGYIGQVIQSLSRTSNVLTLVGSGTWAGLVIGDYVNIVNVLDTSGVSLNVDGTYRVRNFATTSLELEPIGNAPTGGNIVSTNCGGAVIKRTSLRLSFVRVFDYDRERVEMLPRPVSDIGNSVPMVIQGGTLPAVTTVSTVTTVTTVTTVSTVTTVGSVTAANLNFPGIIADVASAGINSSIGVATFTPTFGVSYEVNVGVTTITGGGAVYDLSIEESDDSATNWFRVYDFPRISTSGSYRSPKLPLVGNRVRYIQNVIGVGTFTRSINRLQSSDTADMIRQSITRNINLQGVGATTPFLLTTNCNNAQLQINIGAAAGAPTLVLDGSDDYGNTWYQIGAALTAVANSTVSSYFPTVQAGLLRARVALAGSGVTTGYVLVKGY